MWAYVLSLLLLKKFGLPRPLRYAILIFLFGLLIVVVIYTANLFLTLNERVSVPMSTHIATVEESLTPKHALLTDHVGNEVYASHYAERKAYRLALGCGAVVLLASIGMNVSLAHRPMANRYIRIDEMGRAQAIAYSDLNYSRARVKFEPI